MRSDNNLKDKKHISTAKKAAINTSLKNKKNLKTAEFLDKNTTESKNPISVLRTHETTTPFDVSQINKKIIKCKVPTYARKRLNRMKMNIA